MTFQNFINTNKFKYLKSSLLTVVLSSFLSWIVIYRVEVYGMAIFFLIPFLIGFCTPVFYGKSEERKVKDAIKHGIITLLFFCFALMFFAFEGLICILMAVLPAIPFVILGAYVGFSVVEKRQNNSAISLLIVCSAIPSLGFIEKQTEPTLYKVETSIEIHSSPENVWKQVIEFPQLEYPQEFIFKAGISYPINAKIIGSGVGAIRYCNFNTGSFVEPITRWEEPNLLAFDVKEQPLPMQEISFWDIDAPHLHDYFVSKRGQFQLTKLPNGNTNLTGTTWYYNKIMPSFYWRPWSDYIVHQIHERVLQHIRKNSEERASELSLK